MASRLERAERKNRPDVVAEIEAELAVPPFPVSLSYLWRAYFRLRRRKAAGFNGIVPLEWPDIDAFVRRSGTRFAPWEIELIEDLDGMFIRSMSATAPPPDFGGQAVKDSLERVSKRRVVAKR